MKHLVSLVLILLLWNISSSAQTFVDVAASTGFSVLSQSSGWGNGVSFFDVDEDGWDDLTVCVAGAPTRFYKNNSGSFVLHSVFFNDQETKACVWLDIDEDGDNDLFVTRFDASHQVFLNQGDLVFEDVSANYSNLTELSDYSWGVSFGDFTRDGFLDLCIANYGVVGSSNILARNTASDGFIPLSSEPLINSTKTSFQPIWLDLNKDLLQDLFVINDHNQGNEYYVQSSIGVFEDNSSESGLHAPASAMSNSWCDYDRDGDFDLYITNTIQGNLLMVNNGENVFTDEAIAEGVELNAWSWSALWLDTENDGWEDLYVGSKDLVNDFPTYNFYFKNNQGDFEAQENDGLSNQPFGVYASAKGDFNNDGKIDIVVSTELNSKYKLYQNNSTSTNNYFKFRLKGRLSNRNGIGTRYEYWIGGEKRIGYTYCGEGYLTQNSQNITLGLGAASAIDSLKLFWISGVEDMHYNLSANNFQLFVEGETKPTIVASKNEICPVQDSVQLTISGWPVVMWDTGSFNPERTVYSSGIYTAHVSTGFGHALLLSIEITESAQPLITSSTVQPSCFGDSDGLLQVEWYISNETNSIVESNLSSGFHSLEIPYGQGCTTEVDLVLSEPAELIVFTSANAATCSNENSGSIEIIVSGGTPPYSLGEGTDFVIGDLFAMDYNGVITDANGCAVSWSNTIEEPTPIVISSVEEMPSAWNEGSIVLTVEGGTGGYSYDWSNGNLTAENLNIQAGDYSVSVTDGNGCSVDTTFSLIFNYVNSLNLNTMNWTLHKDGLHYEGTETLHDVFIYDSVGKLLHREQILAAHSCLPLDSNGPLFILSHEGNWKSSISLE